MRAIGKWKKPDDIEIVDSWSNGNIITLFNKEIGYVTVDMRNRIFGLGASQPYKPANKENYLGRGWRRKLLDDAVAYLRAV